MLYICGKCKIICQGLKSNGCISSILLTNNVIKYIIRFWRCVMHSIFFVQVGFAFGESVYLPYAAGTIVACALQDTRIAAKYSFEDFLIFREPIEDAVKKIDSPFLVAFSCYVWNIEYNKALAKRIKELYPDCIIVFGGHSVPEDGSLLETEPYIDFLLFGEGERTFLRLLLELDGGDITLVPSMAYRSRGKAVLTGCNECTDIENLPSAYLSGVFDELIRKNPGVDFLSVLETNRGCPNSCSFCDWCAGRKVRMFPLERVLAEIDWLAEKKIEYCFCADSNFGLFERDRVIVDHLVESKKRTGYPKVFRPCYAKNSEDTVFEICSKLNKNGMDKGATMAYQTLSDDALKNVNRKNLILEHFSALMAKYYEAGISTYSELILGLPGETLESFCTGLCRLLDAGQHNSISVYYCEILPNSEMSTPEYIEKHGIVTGKVPFNHIHSDPKKDGGVEEFSHIVVQTDTMPRADWIKANLFSVCLQAFHNLGLLRCFAIYCRYELSMSYIVFYSSLLSFIIDNTSGKINLIFKTIEQRLSCDTSNLNYANPLFGNTSWFFEEGVFLECLYNADIYTNEIMPFIDALGIDPKIKEELWRYQQLILRRPFNAKTVDDFTYDFPSFFAEVYSGKTCSLEERSCRVSENVENDFKSWADFAREIVWYGRRTGAPLLTGNRIKTEYSKP